MTTSSLTVNWAGVNQTGAGGSFPPDCGIAAGVSDICTTVNDHVDIYSKAGAHLEGESLQTLFGAPASDFVFDPQVTYDQNAGRFIVVAADHTNSNSSIQIAVSKDGNPLDGWYTYDYGVTQSGAWLDRPLLGLDAGALYVAGNYYGNGGGYTESGVWGWNVLSLESGAGPTGYFYTASSFAGFNAEFAPAHMYGAEAGVSDFLIEYNQSNSGADSLNIVRASGAGAGSGSLLNNTLSVGDISDADPAGARQAGTSQTIDDGDTRIENAVWRNDKLYATAEIRVGSGASAHDVVHWFVIDTSNLSTPTLISQGNIDYGPNYDAYYGNLTVDSAGDMIIGYSFSGPSVYASSVYAEISPGGTALQDGGYYLTKGAASYNQVDGSGENRWGDYSGVAIDPTDNTSFWLFNQYAASGSSWGTTIGGVLSAVGQAAMWHMNGTTITGGGAISPNPGPSWQVIGTGDFYSNGASDILWQNPTTGQAAIWEMNGGVAPIGGGVVSADPGPSWHAVGAGADFFGDGHNHDILWQNANGQVELWYMNGINIIANESLTPNPGPSWHAVGTGDFNHDHHSDILFQNANGQVAIWEMNGGLAPIGGGVVSANPGPSWHAVGAGDFFGNGLSDILFQNPNSGQVAIWEMNGTTTVGGGILGPDPGPSWKAIGAGDFFNPGLPGFSADILFQNTSSGQIAIWRMDGTNTVGGGIVGSNPGPSWHAIAANAAGDILFQNRGG